jgi:hypothetical protein
LKYLIEESKKLTRNQKSKIKKKTIRNQEGNRCCRVIIIFFDLPINKQYIKNEKKILEHILYVFLRPTLIYSSCHDIKSKYKKKTCFAQLK